jgi:exonuclease SbcD
MRILHTSDWHLGRMLYSKKDRQEEHNAFLEWLLYTIQEKKIDVLIIAGDIFDTASPSITSQKIYYDFLIKVRTMGCDNVVVVGGNHDSPSFLNAPKEILAAINVSVIGNALENIEDEIVIINDKKGQPAVIVCGVPFLRERDISHFAEGENYTDRSKRINEGIKKHYEEIGIQAEKKRKEIGIEIPIVATGHLTVAGGQRNDDDGVRETYIGNIEAVGIDIFPETFDYVALGHIHIPSELENHIRYCGSPIPMGFGEAGQTKCIYIVDFYSKKNIEKVEIPVFQKMEKIVGNKEKIESSLKELKKINTSVWVEIVYNGEEIFPLLSSWVNDQINNSRIEVLKLINREQISGVLTSSDTSLTLDEIKDSDVFEKCLEKNEVEEDQKKLLTNLYQEIVNDYHSKD